MVTMLVMVVAAPPATGVPTESDVETIPTCSDESET